LKIPRIASEAEESFYLAMRAYKYPLPEREYKFHPTRKFRFDFAWPEWMVALEVEGGIYSGKSRHTTIGGFEKDCIKYALAAQLGWRLYRFSSGQVLKGIALQFIEEEIRKHAK